MTCFEGEALNACLGLTRYSLNAGWYRPETVTFPRPILCQRSQ